MAYRRVKDHIVYVTKRGKHITIGKKLRSGEDFIIQPVIQYPGIARILIVESNQGLKVGFGVINPLIDFKGQTLPHWLQYEGEKVGLKFEADITHWPYNNLFINVAESNMRAFSGLITKFNLVQKAARNRWIGRRETEDEI